MVLNGHVGGDGLGYLESTGDHGNTVYQMLLNTQFEANAGNGWLRVLEFLNDGKTVRARTYSPFLTLSRTDVANQFEFEISQLEPESGDFDGDGDVDGADLLMWQRNPSLGSLDVWQSEYGSSSLAAGSTAIPEPGGWVLSLLATVALPALRK
jgi:hypothetical protein